MNTVNISKVVEELGLLPVIPLTNYDKRPYISWTIQENTIQSMEQLNEVIYSNTFEYQTKEGEVETLNNITGFSLLTGDKSGIIVIDLDTHNEDSNGIDSFKKFNVEHDLDEQTIYNTFTVKTPTGGKHLYYKYNGDDIKSTSGILPGVDVRANGGLIVLPGTTRFIEGRAVQYTIEKDVPILDFPKELLPLVNTGTQSNVSRKTMDLIEIWNTGILSGTRNDIMLKVANKLRPSFSKVEDFAFVMLSLNTTLCNPPLDNDELVKICDSVWSYQLNTKANNFPAPYKYNEAKNYIYKGDDEEYEDEDFDGDDIVYNGYLNIVGRRINVDNNVTQFILESRELNDYNKIVVDGATLFGSNNERDIKTLFGQQKGFVNFGGIGATPKGIIKFLVIQDTYKRKNNLMMDTYYSTNIGWITYNNEKYLCYPNKDIVVDTIESNCDSKIMDLFVTRGTVQEWIDNVLKYIIKSSNGKVMLLSTFASLLVSFLELHENAIIQLEGASSTGKSGCIAGCASVFGTQDYINNWNTTRNGANGKMVLFGSFPLIYDDLKTVDKHLQPQLPNLFYEFVSGLERTRANQDGSIKDSRTFHNLLLTSGEYPVTDLLIGHEGATARVLVLRGSFLPKDKPGDNTNSNIVNTIYKNSGKYYGQVGLEWCKFLVTKKDKQQELKDLYETYRDILTSKTDDNLVARKCNTIALLQVTGHLLEQFFNCDYFNIDSLINTLLVQVEASTKEADTNDNALMDVVEYLLSYKKEVNGNSIVMKQQKVGFFTEDYKYRKKLYGEVVGIKVTNLKTILNELGYNHSTVVRAWAEKGYILKDPAGKTSINIKNIGRTVIIKMIKYKELTGQPLEQPQEHRILEFRNKHLEQTPTDIF